MAQKWTLASSTTTGDRLANVGTAAVHLSTGDLVMLVNDPAQADPNKVTLVLVPGSAHTTPATIATLSTAAAGGNASFSNSSPMTLCRDASDNLFVIGIGLAATGTGGPVVQAFTKGAGLTWTAQAAGTYYYVYGTETSTGLTAVWCNTGGGTNGAGHLAVVYVPLAGGTTPNRTLAVFDAGNALAGLGATNSNPDIFFHYTAINAYTGTVHANTQDIIGNGFGATSGLLITEGGASNASVYPWSVSVGGVPSVSAAISSVSTGTLSATTKFGIYWLQSNRWASVFPSAGNAGQLTVLNFSTTAALSAGVDTGTASNFPAPSAGLSWDAASAGGQLLVYGWSSLTAQTMLRKPFTFPSDVTTLGTTVSDDTSVGSGTNTTIRAVNQPIDTAHLDWQSYNSTTPFSLLGDFTALPQPPNAPTLSSPANNAALVLSTGGTMSWVFSPVTLGDTQTAYAFRRQAAGGAFQWWTGAAWQSSEIFVSTATQSIAFPTGNWAASTTYAWSVATKGASATAGPYSAVRNVYSAATPPSTPSMTATYQAAPNNRVALVVTGTGTDVATVQVSRDGGSTWANLRNGSGALTAGTATFYDYEAQPTVTSQYRVSQTDPTQGIYGLASANSATVTATPNITTFWLRDPAAGTVGMAVNAKDGTFKLAIVENMATHWPLGSQYPVILADTLKGQSGSATFYTLSSAEETALVALLTEQATLLLQTNDGRQFYVRMVGPRGIEVPQGVGSLAYREHPVTWEQVGAP